MFFPKIFKSKEKESCSLTIHDIAKYILKHKRIKNKHIDFYKLIILLFYAKVWHFVWEDEILFPDQPIATEYGVNFPTFEYIIGWDGAYQYSTILKKGCLKKLNISQKESIDAIIKYYGHRDSEWLKSLVTQEQPWIEARSNNIDLIKAKKYYEGLKDET